MRMLISATATATAIALGLAALPLAAADAGSTWRVTLRAGADQVVAGQKVVLTGHARPAAAAAGLRVRLQEKYKPGVPWKTRQQTAKVTRRGTYRLVVRPMTGFTHAYRVILPAPSHHKKGVSPTVKVKVFSWERLTDHTHVNNVRMSFGAVNINGTTFDDSVFAYDAAAASIEFNVNHDCTSLRGTFGLSDRSTVGGQGEVSIAADDTPAYSKTFDVGQSETKRLRFGTAPLKLRLETHSTSTAAGVYGLGAFGSVQVLCTH
jgi:hypothetical protein